MFGLFKKDLWYFWISWIWSSVGWTREGNLKPMISLPLIFCHIVSLLCVSISVSISLSRSQYVSLYIPLCPHNYYLSMYSAILSIYLHLHLSVYFACHLCMLTMIVGFMCVILAVWVANPGAKNMRRKMIGNFYFFWKKKIYIFF